MFSGSVYNTEGWIAFILSEHSRFVLFKESRIKEIKPEEPTNPTDYNNFKSYKGKMIPLSSL